MTIWKAYSSVTAKEEATPAALDSLHWDANGYEAPWKGGDPVLVSLLLSDFYCPNPLEDMRTYLCGILSSLIHKLSNPMYGTTSMLSTATFVLLAPPDVNICPPDLGHSLPLVAPSRVCLINGGKSRSHGKELNGWRRIDGSVRHNCRGNVQQL